MKNCNYSFLSLEESWEIANDLTGSALKLINQEKYLEAIDLALNLSNEHQIDPWIANTAAEIIQWSNFRFGNKIHTTSSIRLAEIGRFAFCSEIDRLQNSSHNKGRFFVSAFMPKSGSTYISNILKSSGKYSTDVYYSFGSADDLYLSPARVNSLIPTRGFFAQDHLCANSWNKSTILQTRAPLWLHLRDPRDTFMSLLDMVKLEKSRDDVNADVFFSSLNLNTYPERDYSAIDYNELATSLYDYFDQYCTWVKTWLEFKSPDTLITTHNMMLTDEYKFFKIVSNFLDFEFETIPLIDKTYKSTRFNVGTNGRWNDLLDINLKNKMNNSLSLLFDIKNGNLFQ